MKQPEISDLERTGMDARRTIATEGKGLKAFTRNQGQTRMRNQARIYKQVYGGKK